jgi:hypothetical protein
MKIFQIILCSLLSVVNTNYTSHVYQHYVNIMVRQHNWSMGNYARRGSMTAEGRCGGSSSMGFPSVSSVESKHLPLHTSL